MPINRLISVIDEQSMLRFFCDCRFHRLSIFIDYRCQSISFKVCFCCWFLKPCNCIQTIRWTNSNLKHLCVLRVRIRTCWNVWDTNIFLTPIDDNRWVATTFVWLSIGHRLADANRCQLTNKASIVIDWSIDFPIIGFIDCTGPDYYICLQKVLLSEKWNWFFMTNYCTIGFVMRQPKSADSSSKKRRCSILVLVYLLQVLTIAVGIIPNNYGVFSFASFCETSIAVVFIANLGADH